MAAYSPHQVTLPQRFDEVRIDQPVDIATDAIPTLVGVSPRRMDRSRPNPAFIVFENSHRNMRPNEAL
jgi:hypothetical protein